MVRFPIVPGIFVNRLSYIYKICSELITQTTFIPFSSGIDNDSLLYKVLSYINDNYEDNCTLEQIAKELGYEYTYVSKYFQGKMGISYTSYLNQYR
ncbi:MAG: AraC family transcriptional regulator, partial [Alphaproteobacteria bacterium]|nr:AraC family transcriptional regulator [Alphaproteobacteria bacterium]